MSNIQPNQMHNLKSIDNNIQQNQPQSLVQCQITDIIKTEENAVNRTEINSNVLQNEIGVQKHDEKIQNEKQQKQKQIKPSIKINQSNDMSTFDQNLIRPQKKQKNFLQDKIIKQNQEKKAKPQTQLKKLDHKQIQTQILIQQSSKKESSKKNFIPSKKQLQKPLQLIAKQDIKRIELKQKGKDGKIKQKQIQKQKEKQKKKVTKQQKKQQNQLSKVQIEISRDSLAPTSKNINIIGVLQIKKVSDELIDYFQSHTVRKIIIKPLAIIRKNSQTKEKQINKSYAIFSIEYLIKYTDIQIKLQDQLIYCWIVELFYQLYMHRSHIGLPQLTKENIYLTDSPFLSNVLRRQEQYYWHNQLKTLLADNVCDQTAFIAQITNFGYQFKQIKDIESLKLAHFKFIYEKYKNQFFSVANLVTKVASVKKQVQYSQNKIMRKEQEILSQKSINWIKMQFNQLAKMKFVLYYQASSCNFEPIKFWEKALSNFKTKDRWQLLLLQIQMQDSKTKQIGFYSNIFGHMQMSKLHLGEYVIDNEKKSVLLNISSQTIHPLNDSAFAFMFNNNILLCVGKCDVVLSAFNITNLCYFPVSYDSDAQGQCNSADLLCGSKKFKLKDLYVFRFQ